MAFSKYVTDLQKLIRLLTPLLSTNLLLWINDSFHQEKTETKQLLLLLCLPPVVKVNEKVMKLRNRARQFDPRSDHPIHTGLFISIYMSISNFHPIHPCSSSYVLCSIASIRICTVTLAHFAKKGSEQVNPKSSRKLLCSLLH